MALASKTWTSLPEHIVVQILSYMPLEDKYKASLVCSFWNQCFKSQYLWQRFNFEFFVSSDTRFLQCVRQFGHYLQHVSIELNQSDVQNRENACAVLDRLARTDKRRLNSIRIRFMGENPLFYAGAEFISSLKILFGPSPESVKPYSQIKAVDLSGLMAAVSEEVLDLLSANNPELEKLNILINTLVCKISPDCIIRLLNRCRSLKDLRLYHASVTDDVLLALIEEGRKPLKHLGIKCRREEKYRKDLSSDVWSKLAKKLPDLRVTLGFDHTCPLRKVAFIMQPEVPASAILFETYTQIYDEVNLVTTYYSETLEKIVIHTRTSPEFEKALVKLSKHCPKLNSIYVFNCVLPKEIIEEVLHNRPDMRDKGTYVLRSEHVPETDYAVVGVESGD